MRCVAWWARIDPGLGHSEEPCDLAQREVRLLVGAESGN